MKAWHRVEQLFKRNGMWLLERLLGKRVVRPSYVNFSKIGRILVVRQHDQLGDFLLCTPVFRALRERFPDAHIIALVRSYVAPVVDNNPYVDNVLVFEESGRSWSRRKLVDFWRGLRSGYDLAVVINTVSHSFTSDLLAHFSGARYVLGSEHMVFPGCRRNFFYNLIAPYWSGARHQTLRSLDIVRYLGIDTDDRSEVMALRDEEIAWARQFLAGHGVGRGDVLVSCHVGAGKLSNRWPVENYAEVANRLHEEDQAHVLVSWGPKEEELGEQFLSQTRFEPIRAYGFSLRELAALVACSAVYVGSDTGILHLAAAVGVPLVGIYGPTDPSQWLPFGDRFVALRGKDGRCESVQVREVVTQVRELISRYAGLPERATLEKEEEDVTTAQVPDVESEDLQFDISDMALENYLERIEKSEKGDRK